MTGPGPGERRERGMALVATLLLLLVLSTLAAGLTISGQVEVAMARNEAAFAGARAAAEAGLNRGVDAVLDAAGGGLGGGLGALLLGPDEAANAADPADPVNADNGSLAGLIGGAPPWALGADGRFTYDIRILDDDDPSLYEAPLTAAELAVIGEDGSALTDANSRFVVRGFGFGPGGTTVAIDSMLVPDAAQAILVDGSLRVSGNPDVLGTAGSVHANVDLTVSGVPTVTGDATASEDYNVSPGWSPGGVGDGSRPLIPVPAVRASDYLGEADYILNATGQIESAATGLTVCDSAADSSACKDAYGWAWSSDEWDLSEDNAAVGTYYAESGVKISGAPGSAALPLAITVIAEGSISVSGNPALAPEASSGLLFVADGDLKLSGNFTQSPVPEGRLLVHEQLQLSGNPVIFGQILVEDAAQLYDDVEENVVSGQPVITYNGVGPSSYTVGGWRESQ